MPARACCIKQTRMVTFVQHRSPIIKQVWGTGFQVSEPLRGRTTKVQQLVAELFPSLLSLNQQIKGLCQCQANRPLPTGYRLDDREQIKQKDKCSLRVWGSISDSSDPRQFFIFLPPCLFSLPSLALILLLKVTAGNTAMLWAQVQSSVFFG